MFIGSDINYQNLKKVAGITICLAFLISLLNLLATENIVLQQPRINFRRP